jgi:hypothetical protein
LHDYGCGGGKPQDRATGNAGRNLGCLRCPHDVDRILSINHTQRDARRDIRLNVGRYGPGGALSRQHEVDSERAALRGDPHEPREKLRKIVREGPKLINNDNEPGEKARLIEEVGNSSVCKDAFSAREVRA